MNTSKNSRFLQITAYVMLTAIFIIAISAIRNCSKISYIPKEGFSGGDTIDIALIYGPANYYFESDSLSGINYHVALDYSSQNNTPIKIWPVSEPAEALSKLQNGAFDIVASLPLDNYLRKNFSISESVFLDRLVLVQLTDSLSGAQQVNSSLDLNGKEVNVSAGSSGIQRLKNLSEEIGGGIKIIENPGLSDELLCLQVASGEIPLAIVNEKIAREISLQYPNLNYDNTISFTQFQVWVFNSEDSILSQKFDKWFDSYRTTTTYRSLIDRF